MVVGDKILLEPAVSAGILLLNPGRKGDMRPERSTGGDPDVVSVMGAWRQALGKPTRAISSRASWTQRAARSGLSFRVWTSFNEADYEANHS